MLPPPEIRKDFPDLIWQVKKRVYGLCDAPRGWWLEVDSSLKKLGLLDVPAGTDEEDDLYTIIVVLNPSQYIGVQFYTFNNNNKLEEDESGNFSTHPQSSDNCENLYILSYILYDFHVLSNL